MNFHLPKKILGLVLLLLFPAVSIVSFALLRGLGFERVLAISSRINVDKTVFDFETTWKKNPLPQSIQIFGDDHPERPISWRFTLDFDDGTCGAQNMYPGVIFSPLDGSTAQSVTSTITVQIPFVPPGECYQNVKLVATGGEDYQSVAPVVIRLNFQISDPEALLVSLTELSFSGARGQNPECQKFTVSKGAASASSGVNWYIVKSEGADWLILGAGGVYPVMGNSGTPTEVSVCPKTSSLVVGDYQAVLKVRSTGIAPKITREVAVGASVFDSTGRLTVAPKATDFYVDKGQDAEAKQIVISGDRERPLLWELTYDPQEEGICVSKNMLFDIVLSEVRGITSTPRTITITPKTSTSQVSGVCYQNLKITAVQGQDKAQVNPVTARLNFYIRDVDRLTVSPASLSFSTRVGQNPACQTFAISKASSAESAAWEVRVPRQEAWLPVGEGGVSPSRGNSATLTDVSVCPKSSSLASSSYSAVIEVRSLNLAPKVIRSVAISLSVLEVPPPPQVTLNLLSGWNEISWENSYGDFRPATLPLGCVASGKYEGLFGGFLKDWISSLIWPAHADELYVRCKAASAWILS